MSWCASSTWVACRRRHTWSATCRPDGRSPWTRGATSPNCCRPWPTTSGTREPTFATPASRSSPVGLKGTRKARAIRASLPLVHENFRRTIHLVTGEQVVYVQSELENLLASTRISASAVAFASFRMEPQFMILGHSSGVAASMALKDNLAALVEALFSDENESGLVPAPPELTARVADEFDGHAGALRVGRDELEARARLLEQQRAHQQRRLARGQRPQGALLQST